MSDVLPHAPGRWPDALLPRRRRPRGASLQRARVLGLGGEILHPLDPLFFNPLELQKKDYLFLP